MGIDKCGDLLEVGYGPTSKEELCVSRGVVGGVEVSESLSGESSPTPGQVGSSWTGNLHPTPCIEWLQGKRGDPGCMAKASALRVCI